MITALLIFRRKRISFAAVPTLLQFSRRTQRARDLFDRLPGIFWFDQFRNLATSPGSREVESNEGLKEEPAEQVAYAVGVSRLREYLNRWKLQKLRHVRDVRTRLTIFWSWKTRLTSSFPTGTFPTPSRCSVATCHRRPTITSCSSTAPRPMTSKKCRQGNNPVFPMLYEFVRQRISNSIVLIDEIDLNLHPPIAQALLASLPRIGADCQFLYTTHSRAISEIVSPNEVHRLEGGRPCL